MNKMIVSFLIFSLPSVAYAGFEKNDASSDQMKSTLIEGAVTKEGAQYAGLSLKLAEGWKTYWRSPGDSGIPPQFDWSKSENIENLEVIFPSGSRWRIPMTIYP